MFEQIHKQLKLVSESSSLKDKKSLIEYGTKNIPYFSKVCYYALDPLKRFKMTSLLDELVTTDSITTNNPEDIFQFLDFISNSTGVSKTTKQHLSNLVGRNDEDREVINYIVSKDLRCGAAIKLFKEYIPEIFIHVPMLCIDDAEKFLQLHPKENIIWQLKLDGVRVWAINDGNTIRYLSRNGKEFPNFNKFDDMVKIMSTKLIQLGHTYPIVFDGEVISKAKDFQQQMTQVRRLKDANPEIFKFVIFDVVKDSIKYNDRLVLLEISHIVLLTKLNVDKSNCDIDIIQSVEIDDVYSTLETITNSGEEGIILKTKDHYYEYKRSNHWCKMKKFYTVDLPVVGWEYGNGKFSEVIGAFVCDFNGTKVRVGGLKDDERRIYMEETPTLIEVKYQEITKDGSLRFPTFVRVRDDK